MKENTLFVSLLGMLGIASFLFLVGFSNVNQEYQVTAKIAPVFVDIRENFIHRHIEKMKQKVNEFKNQIFVADDEGIEIIDEQEVVQQSEKDKSSQSVTEFPLDVPLINQMDAPHLFNGCEVTSLAMLLQFYGIDVSKNELADQIAKVPFVYENGLRGNPNQGFVGDMINGPGLSVHHGPILYLAQKYVGERAVDLTGSDPSVIYDYLEKGHPVWIITTTNLTPVNNFETWDTPQGQIEVTFNTHSVVVTGYNEDYVYVNDPYGMKNKKVDRNNFEKAWVQMGSQAIVIDG